MLPRRGKRALGVLHTQGVALGYRRLCRWHIGQNEVTPIAMTQFTKSNPIRHSIGPIARLIQAPA